MNNVLQMNKEKQFKKEQELYSRIVDLIHEYDGEISLVAALGALELAKTQIIQEVGANEVDC